jgi:hypothetical protein
MAEKIIRKFIVAFRGRVVQIEAWLLKQKQKENPVPLL